MLKALRRYFPLAVIFFLFSFNASATHIMGGELTYVQLPNGTNPNLPFRYRVTLKAYVDRNSSFPNGNLGNNPRVYIFNADDGTRYGNNTIQWQILTNNINPNTPRTGTGGIIQFEPVPEPVIPALPSGCNPACISDISVALNTFIFEISLPFTLNGYHLMYESVARNTTVNLANNNAGNTYYAKIPSPQYGDNSSPQFTDLALPFMLVNDTTTFVNSAFDPDGDRLEYRFVTPYSGQNRMAPNVFPGIDTVRYNPGFNKFQPFGLTGSAFINPTSGLTQYFTTITGSFALGLEVLEYRTLPNGQEVLLSSTRRELQFFVRATGNGPGLCPINISPILNGGVPNAPLRTGYTITEGETVSFRVGAQDLDTNTVILSASGTPFSSSFVKGNLASFPRDTFPTVGSSVFTWTPSCGDRGFFNVTVSATDLGCPPKSTPRVINISVLPFKGPSSIAGPTNTCGGLANSVYSIANVAAGQTRTWKAIGGTIQPGTDNTTAVVRWNTTNPILRAITTSIHGCVDSVSVNISNQIALKPSTINSTTICEGSSIELTTSGGTANITWSPATGLSATNVRSPVAKPTVTTTYVVSTSSPQGCDLKDTVTITVIPAIKKDSAKTVCNVYNGNVGAVYNPNYSYKWIGGDTLDLDRTDTAVALALSVNNTPTKVVKQFILRGIEKNTGCTSFDTVIVNLEPLPTLGLIDTVVCSGFRFEAGTPSQGPRYTYRWNISRFLTDSTASQVQIEPINNSRTIDTLFYVLTAFDSTTGCENTDTMRVIVLPMPTVGIKDTFACDTLPIMLGSPSIPGYVYSFSPTQHLSDTTIGNPIFQFKGTVVPQNFAYTYMVVNVAKGCTLTKNFEVKLRQRPVAFAGNDSLFCARDSVQIGITPEPGRYYRWIPDTGLSNPNIANPKIFLVNPFDAFYTKKYALQVFDSISGCFNIDTVAFTLRPRTIVYASKDTAVCHNSTFQIGDAPTVNYTYRWNKSTNLTDSTISNPIYTALNTSLKPRRDTLILYAFNPNTGCFDRDSLFVTIHPLPSITNGDTALCSGDTIRLGDTAVFGLKYHWSPALGLSDTNAANPKVSFKNLGTVAQTYQYTYTVTNDTTGCVNVKTIILTVNPRPTYSLTLPDTVCADNDFAAANISNTALFYTFYDQNGRFIDTGLNAKIRLYNFTDTAQKQNVIISGQSRVTGCPTYDTISVIVKPQPKLNVGLFSDICSRETLTLGVPDTGIYANKPYRYQWSPALGLSATNVRQPQLTLVNNTDTTQIVRYILTVTDTVLGCPVTDTLTLRLNPLPPLRAGLNDTLCSYSNTVLGTDSLVGYTYRWFFVGGRGNGIIGAVSDSTFAKPRNLIANISGNDKVVPLGLELTDVLTGCKSIDTLELYLRDLPRAIAFTGGDTAYACVGNALQLGAAAKPSVRYTWNNSTGMATGADLSSNPVVTLSYNGEANDTTIRYILNTINDTTGCTHADTVIVKLHKLPTNAYFLTDTVCSSIGTRLNAQSKPNMAYQWKGGADVYFTTPNSNVTEFKVDNFTASAFSRLITLVFTDTMSGCSDSISKFVAIRPAPKQDAGPDLNICSDAPVNLGSTGNDPNRTFQWVLLNGINPNLPIVLSDISQPTLTIRAINRTNATIRQGLYLRSNDPITGCFYNDTMYINVYPRPRAIAASSATINACNATPIVLGAAPNPDHIYQWSGAAGLDSLNKSNPTLIPQNNTQSTINAVYKLTATDTVTKCSYTDSVTVQILPSPPVSQKDADTLCSGNILTLGVPASTALYRYRWTPINRLSNDTISNPTFARSIPDNDPTISDTFTLTATNRSTGCTIVKQLIVRTFSRYTADAGINKTVCSGDSIQIGTTPIADRTYRWISRGYVIPNTSNPFIKPRNLSTTPRVDTFILEVGNGLTRGCFDYDTVLVTVNPEPIQQSVVAGSTVVCPNLQGVVYRVGQLPGYSYQWNVRGGTIASPQGRDSIVVNWGPGNLNALVSCTPTTPQGCVGKIDSISIIIRQQLKPFDPSGPKVVCFNDRVNVRYITGSTPNSNYRWFVQYDSARQRITTQVFTGAQAALFYTFTTATRYKLWIEETNAVPGNAFICQGFSDTTYVDVVPSPDTTLEIQGPDNACVAGGNYTYSLAGLPGSVYTWSFSPSDTNSAAIDLTSLANTVNARFKRAGSYVLKVIEKSANSCITDTIRKVINVYPKPQVSLRPLIDGNVCLQNRLGKVYKLTNTLPGSTFKWLIKGGEIVSDSTADSVIVDWDKTTSPKVLKVNEVSINGCISDTFNINIIFDNSELVLNYVSRQEVGDSIIDLNFELKNAGLTPANANISVWRRVKGTTNWVQLVNLPKTTRSYTDANPANNRTTIYEYDVRINNACAGVLSDSVQNIVTLAGFANQNTNTSRLNWNKFVGWSTGIGAVEIWRKLDNETSYSLYRTVGIDDMNFSAENGGDAFTHNYRIKYVDKSGLRFSWSNIITLKFENVPQTANIFTPNGDGFNDTFEIANLLLYPENEVWIYNRWGKEVFNRKNYRNDWDGGTLDEGEYFYFIKVYGNKPYERKGTLTILR